MSYVKNFLTPSEVQSILEQFSQLPAIEEMSEYVADINKLPAAAHYNLPKTIDLVPRIEEVLRPIYGKLEFQNTYTRRYSTGHRLKIHTDRDGLDVTVSLCLQRDTPWHLHVSAADLPLAWNQYLTHSPEWFRVYSSYDLAPGDFVHCLGRRNPHWRDVLKCAPDKHNVYCFLHWSIK